MEDTQSTTRERTTGNDGNREADNTMLMNSKPLHRFVQREPRSLGIIILMCGCAEVLMGFVMAGENTDTSYKIYVPFWQGALFLVCGILSIYTELHPSKRMVTVCLAMNVVTLLGVIVSIGYRIHCFGYYTFLIHRHHYYDHPSGDDWTYFQVAQLFGVEVILFLSSLCVSAILIFLCVVARFALKSTHTQIIIRHIPQPRSDTTSN
ncbi:uncharacterized protein PAE49_014208 [Odontesthes bonariensis]|uniref:uncharacterized protein LOC142397717 n=1 Tax=Odontesthes bonariensis TaxID=219752 RepID=UPI003F58F404